jgi:predicted component of type VI protein secretion system
MGEPAGQTGVASEPPTKGGPASLLHAGRRIAVPPGGLGIGRDEDNDLVLDSERACRMHARLQLDGDGYALEDLGSQHGTLLSGERLCEQRRRLRSGDTIELGDEPMRFLEGEETRRA